MPSLTALCDLVLSPGSTPLTCVPLAAVEHIPSAAHLLPFYFVLRLHLLTGHVTTEASLDLCSSPVGLGVIQGDVHDVLFLLGPAALLLVRGPKKIVVYHSRIAYYMIECNSSWNTGRKTNCYTIFCKVNCMRYSTFFFFDSEGFALC